MTGSLAPEDALRLNVLLATKPLAIRINESSMTVFALTDKGESNVVLNPNGRHEQYIKRVKELLSGHFLGSPGGYPIYLQRWTRMGQMRDDSIADLLLLGEPEAVVAAVCAPGISPELAARAWWAMEDSENARRLLEKEAIAQSDLGQVLASYLIEYLPFETEAEQIIRTVALILQEGLISSEQRLGLWKKAARKSPFYAGFLIADTYLPTDTPENKLLSVHQDALVLLANDGNPYAAFILHLLSQQGQSWLETAMLTLKKPTTQDVVTITLEHIRARFFCFRKVENSNMSLDELSADSQQTSDYFCDQMNAVIVVAPEFRQIVIDCRWLSGLSYGVLRPLLKDSTAIGSLRRKKIEPFLTQTNKHLDNLLA